MVNARRLAAAAALAAAFHSAPALAMECHGDPTSKELAWYERFCSRITDTWKRGRDEMQFSGYSWHLPFTYTKEKRDELNPYSWGLGYARTVEEPNGDTHSVFGLVFSDSHKNAQFNVGYNWMTYWGARDSLQPGLGYAAFIVQRPDIASGIPFPAILPMFALRYDQFVLQSTFIPTLNGGINNGSVLYVFGRYTFD